MGEVKRISACVAATLTTGISLVDGFAGVQEAYSHMVGHEVFTHEMASEKLGAQVRDAILAQHPDLPVIVPDDDFLRLIADLQHKYPNGLLLKGGSTARTESPVATLAHVISKRQS